MHNRPESTTGNCVRMMQVENDYHR